MSECLNLDCWLHIHTHLINRKHIFCALLKQNIYIYARVACHSLFCHSHSWFCLSHSPSQPVPILIPLDNPRLAKIKLHTWPQVDLNPRPLKLMRAVATATSHVCLCLHL
jgi:hypothetical protein